MWVAHFVRRNHQLHPDRLAMADGRRQLTWRQLDERTDAMACGLLDRGLTKGSLVAVSSRNRVEVLEIYIAAAKAGVIVCPLNHTFPAPEVEYRTAQTSPAGTIAEQAILDRLGPAFGDGWHLALDSSAFEELAHTTPRPLPLPRQDDVFAILHTAATTGRPKGVVVTHRSVSACYTAMAAEVGFRADDVMLNPCPLFHGSMVIGLALLAAGGALILQEEFSPQRFLTDLEKHRATQAFVVPSMVRFAMRAKKFADTDLSSLRQLMFGGAPMTEELLREGLGRFQCDFSSVYGITECGGPIATVRFPQRLAESAPGSPDAQLLHSAGRMLPGCHIEVQDDDGRRVPAGTMGEVCVRGDGMMLRYWQDPQATATTVQDGWLRTGDLGHADENGFLYLVDRRNDVILRGGQNVYPQEIERVLSAQPGVEDVAVVGVPSDDWGQVPVAFVVAGTVAPTATDLLTACAAQLASYKRPVTVHFVAEIPRSAAGKILRRVLREQPVPGLATVPPRGSGAPKAHQV